MRASLLSRTLKIIVVLSVLALTAPAVARADDCGAGYVACLSASDALGTSDQLHEEECYGDYLSCVSRSIRVV